MKHITVLLSVLLLAFFALLARATSAEELRLDCIPGHTIQLTGSAPPATALLVRFGGRPVGGGVSRADGSYSIPLSVGSERSGEYAVRVEVRESGVQVGAFVCVVPGAGQPVPQRGATAAPTIPGAPTGRPTATVAPTITPLSTATATLTSTPDPRWLTPGVCSPSYPDFCIPVGQDVDCGELDEENFTVLEPDPYDLDRNNNGLGCEPDDRKNQ